MHNIIIAFIFVLVSTLPASAESGLNHVKRPHDVKYTADRLETVLKEKGMTVFLRINHSEGARKVAKQLRPTEAESDFDSQAQVYKINKIVGQYHSALEHTFLWVVEAQDFHLIQEFCVATGVATINKLKIVPLITSREGVISRLMKIHSL